MASYYDKLPAEFRGLSNQEAVAMYAAGGGRVAEAVVGLTPEQLQAFPVPGTWSIQQIAVHLLDTDLIAAYRMKRIIAENLPRLDVYDENAFAEKLGYERMPIAEVGQMFRLNRLLMGTLLRGLPEAAFERVAQHPESGVMTLGQFVRLYVWHIEHHMRFLLDKRARVLCP
jgi:hypothetical protein